jgi:hypothetical protein
MRRVIIPDSHGQYADMKAIVAAVDIIKKVKPQSVVGLGDHSDCGGPYSKWGALYLDEMEYDSDTDFAEAEHFFAEIRRAVPRAEIDVLEGNHEHHIERWAVGAMDKVDAKLYLISGSPPARMAFNKKRIRYHRRSIKGPGMDVPGYIQLEGCAFTHGNAHGIHATYNMLRECNTNLVHGHTHRAAHVTRRLANGDVIFGASPGTLARLQMFYQHTQVSQHSHGVGLQEIDSSGRCWHFNVAIHDGEYRLP